ncbi:T9SS type A sorting domain-containing protein [Hymenobacter sp. HSC-4F20]|uniref:T9SS type A sorting domain-containing protein n=1 Tax=Hymenobacter sp. HSC-4F20 TaxID=2864135 RepID=UPI001C73E05E|nr:T9SS type A sorting domain-containing protein [Hymenobacter sp. HSC-4F20]MBX0292680.1 T9SS type A sorting domain-containing protein [Hymenobacter sp. HSC-4F20]
MRVFTFAWCLALPTLFVTLPTTLRAQVQPDPTFQAPAIYQPATVYAARQFSDGSRIVTGTFLRADGVPAARMVRYLPSGALDVAFNTAVANNAWFPYMIEELPGGKILVSSNGNTMTVSGQTRVGMVRLNANGTLDTSFTGSVALNSGGSLNDLLVQPDGKIVLCGNFTQLNGQTASYIARLNADGSRDAAFTDAGAGFDGEPYALARQPDGKLLAAGDFNKVGAAYRKNLARLNADGSLDTNFDIHSTSGTASAVALQPDGKILLSGGTISANGNYGNLLRLLPSGATDTNFLTSSLTTYAFNYLNTDPIQVQPDGKIVVLAYHPTMQLNSQNAGRVVRLLASGRVDPDFQSSTVQGVGALYSLQLLANGQLLVGGTVMRYATPNSNPTGVGLLNSDGSYNYNFMPTLLTGGSIADFVRQADGKIVIGGSFTEVGGTAVSNLARLNPDGSVDQTYAANAQLTGGTVSDLLLLPNGNVLAAGRFLQAGGFDHRGIARLLSTGAPDASFAPTLLPRPATGLTPASTVVSVVRMGRQSSGAIVIGGDFAAGNGGPELLARITAAGQVDNTFRMTGTSATINDLVVHPDDRVTVAGYYATSNTSGSVWRLLANGTFDQTFALTPGNSLVNTLLPLPNGQLLAGGTLVKYGNVTTSGVVRLQDNGTADASFVSGLPVGVTVRSIALQPDQRLLLGGNLPGGGTGRLLPDGAVDPTYVASQGPAATVTKVEVQTDGKFLVAGSFQSVAGQPQLAIARLQQGQVLHLRNSSQQTALTVAPNPVHDVLTISMDVAAKPSSLALRDITGKILVSQPVTAAEHKLRLPNIKPGVYLLEVAYATGPVTCRVVVE